MKGDRVEVVVENGGSATTYEVTATKAGRRVEIRGPTRGMIEVDEVTRNGEPVRHTRFMASRVIALVEHPATE